MKLAQKLKLTGLKINLPLKEMEKEETKDFECCICHKHFRVNQQAYILELGEFTKGDIGDIGFTKFNNCLTTGYMCIDCAFKVEEIVNEGIIEKEI